MAIEVVIAADYSSADVQANKLEAHGFLSTTEFTSAVPALVGSGNLMDS